MLSSRVARRAITIGTHAALWCAGLWLALSVRFDFGIPAEYRAVGVRVLPVLLLIRIVSFWSHGLFHGMLRYAGVPELKSVVRATTIGSLVLGVTGLLVHRLALPRTIYILEWLLAVATAGGLRMLIRMAMDRSLLVRPNPDAPGVILFGAGNAGELLIRDMMRTQGSLRIVAVFDDDPSKRGLLLHGFRVLGPIDRKTVAEVAEGNGVKRAILAMPTAPGVRTREILEMCRELGIQLQTLPSLQAIADGNVRVSLLRDIAIEDLLRRDPVTLDSTAISQDLRGRRVIVTGAAGSIGSELVRQIANFRPARIALFDHNENGLFFLEREVRERFPEIGFDVLLGDIRDVARVQKVFEQVRPEIVYHAAAHKHVPLMESNPSEAVRNNVIGTKVVADAAAAHRCAAFVLISTDKAVNPTSVMGATKRVAEMYVQSLSGGSTRFVAVRFGNVLGSAGSVVPIFRAQIEAGGPVRVTHPEMRRYFMTIPEACQLVLQASALGKGGEIFILDMGEPVKIVDLARDMIVLSGLRPEIDVQIEFTGVRPGEKLYEELMLGHEAALATAHPKIRVAKIAKQSPDSMRRALEHLDEIAQEGSVVSLRNELTRLVPEANLTGAKPASTPAPDAKDERAPSEHVAALASG